MRNTAGVLNGASGQLIELGSVALGDSLVLAATCCNPALLTVHRKGSQIRAS